jgi:hypothetical protein
MPARYRQTRLSGIGATLCVDAPLQKRKKRTRCKPARFQLRDYGDDCSEAELDTGEPMKHLFFERDDAIGYLKHLAQDHVPHRECRLFGIIDCKTGRVVDEVKVTRDDIIHLDYLTFHRATYSREEI